MVMMTTVVAYCWCWNVEASAATPKYATARIIGCKRDNKLSSSFKLLAVGVLSLLAFGMGIAYYGYATYIYPVDEALGNLARAESAQSPMELADYVYAAKRTLPKEGNPVWSFPTARTDFGLIQLELDNIISRANSVASVEPHSSAYNTGMNDMHVSLDAIQENIIEALPYMYVSTTNMAVSAVWIAVILGLFALMRRGKARYKEFGSSTSSSSSSSQ